MAINPRRSTRVASLARFRYRESDDSDDDAGKSKVKEESPEAGDDGSSSSSSSLSELSFGSDIEDAVGPRRKASARAKKATSSAAATGKRKRAPTVTAPANGLAIRSSNKRRAGASPEEPDDQAAAKREIKEEEEKEEKEGDSTGGPTPKKAPRRVRKPARVVTTKIKREGGDGADETTTTHVEPPSDWEEMYRLVKAMRLGDGPAANAAVDTMGCERLAQASASPRERRFHTLVALMLSSQTKDTVNAVVMARLQAELPAHAPGAAPGLTVENMLAVDPARLNQLIWQVGFHNNKTRYLKQAAEIMRDQWDGDIPPTAEALMALPGVGPKMAYLCLAAEHGWNRVEGIGVDVHVHRLTNLWGWQAPNTKTPEATRLALQSWLPRDKWKEINWLLVGFGQTVCPSPQGARCGECTLGLRGLCRAADRRKVAEGRRRLEQQQQNDAADDEVVKE